MFKKIFDVFSARPQVAANNRHDIPDTTRTRVLRWVNEIYGGSRHDLGGGYSGDLRAEFWEEIARRILFSRLRKSAILTEVGSEFWHFQPYSAIRAAST